jgi:hypothetical protein
VDAGHSAGDSTALVADGITHMRGRRDRHTHVENFDLDVSLVNDKIWMATMSLLGM